MAEKSFALDAVIKEAVYLLGFLLLTVFWKFDFPPFMVLVIAILNNGTIMTISKDKVQPSPHPDSWKLSEIFATGIVLGGYLALMTVLFFWASYETNFFPNRLGVENFNRHNLYMSDDLNKRMASAVYLQVSTISQALIFVTRCGRWSYAERPGFLLVIAFVITQLIARVISATATSKFSGIRKISWGWTGVIWLFNIATFSLLDPLQVAVRYALTGRFWRLVVDEGVLTGVWQALEIVQVIYNE